MLGFMTISVRRFADLLFTFYILSSLWIKIFALPFHDRVCLSGILLICCSFCFRLLMEGMSQFSAQLTTDQSLSSVTKENWWFSFNSMNQLLSTLLTEGVNEKITMITTIKFVHKKNFPRNFFNPDHANANVSPFQRCLWRNFTDTTPPKKHYFWPKSLHATAK